MPIVQLAKQTVVPKSVKSKDPVIAVTPEGKRIYQYNKDGKPICFSKRGGDKGRCQSTLTFPNGRCKMHGGKAPSGITHWNAQHLRTANNLPGHLQGDMNRALNDPDRLSSDHEIALIDTLIATQKSALGTGLGANAYKLLLKLCDKLEDALENDPESSEELCTKIIETIRLGVKEREVWEEIEKTVETRRKLVETAHKREIQNKVLLRADQAVALITAIASVCKEQIGKTCTQIEIRYQLTDIETGKIVPRIDASIKTQFLSSVGIGLGRLIGSVRPQQSNVDKGEPVTSAYDEKKN